MDGWMEVPSLINHTTNNNPNKTNKQGLFHRAISLSGSPNITLALPEAEMQNAGVVRDGPCAHHNTSAARLRCVLALALVCLVL